MASEQQFQTDGGLHCSWRQLPGPARSGRAAQPPRGHCPATEAFPWALPLPSSVITASFLEVLFPFNISRHIRESLLWPQTWPYK